MTAPLEKNHPKYPRRNVAEDRAWRRLYRDAADPLIAAELVRHLDDDARRIHLALYLRCQRTLRKSAARQRTRGQIAAFALSMWRSFQRWLNLEQAPHRQEARQPIESVAATGRDLTWLGLQTIEADAERANPVQLRAWLSTLRLNRLVLGTDERAGADALILKVEHLLQEQRVEPLSLDQMRVIESDSCIAVIEPGSRPTERQLSQRTA